VSSIWTLPDGFRWGTPDTFSQGLSLPSVANWIYWLIYLTYVVGRVARGTRAPVHNLPMARFWDKACFFSSSLGMPSSALQRRQLPACRFLKTSSGVVWNQQVKGLLANLLGWATRSSTILAKNSILSNLMIKVQKNSTCFSFRSLFFPSKDVRRLCPVFP